MIEVTNLAVSPLIQLIHTTPIIKGGSTALILAAQYDRAEVTRLLVADERTELDHEDEEGSTALNSAVSRGHVDVIRELLQAHRLDLNHLDAV